MSLQREIERCTLCADFLNHEVRPVLSFHPKSKVAIVGQAPGQVVHETGIPWNDKSGQRLRQWLGVDSEMFYNPENFAIVPMGFCYPGKGTSGDLPPRPECAPKWHDQIFTSLPKLKLIVLIGQYAQGYYLGDRKKTTLTETVKAYQEYLPNYFVLPHPSPRNNIWLKKNPWFEGEVLAELRRYVNLLVI